MRELDKALADIVAIRSQIAAGTAFRGYGPVTIALTGGLALLTAGVQSYFAGNLIHDPLLFLGAWGVTAVVAVGMIGIETHARTQRHHTGLADAMIQQATEQFLPAGMAAALLPFLFWKFMPQSLWMLPGLWQLLISLGVFASARSLPRSVMLVGAWYFVAGFVTLMLASASHTLTPWLMGVPFAGGQLLLAGILYFASGDDVEED